jgi:RNA polymerase sigma-70 factor (ECF subfamily)
MRSTAAQGMSYEETAAVWNVAVNTIKSRVDRARFRLLALLGLKDEIEIGPDSVTKPTLPVERLLLRARSL